MNRQITSDYDDFSGEDSGGSFVDQIDLQQYLRVLRKYKWPITLFTALVTALAVYYAYTATPIYRSTSTLLIEQQGFDFDPNASLNQNSYDYYHTQYELLKSRELALRVVKRLGLEDHPNFAVASASVSGPEASLAESDTSTPGVVIESELAESPAGADTVGPAAEDSGAATVGIQSFVAKLKSLIGLSEPAAPTTSSVVVSEEQILSDATEGLRSLDLQSEMVDETLWNDSLSEEEQLYNTLASRFLGGLSVDPVRNTKLVRVSYDSADPALAAKLANTVADEYILSYLDNQMERRNQAQEWLDSQLQTLKANVEKAEAKLVAYQQENGLVDVGGVGGLNAQELMLLTTEQAQVRNELSNVRDLRNKVRSLRSTSPALLETLPAFQNDPLIRNIKIEQGVALRNLEELSTRYGSKHPKILETQSTLDTLQANLNQHITRVADSIESDYQLVSQRLGAIQSKLNSGKAENQAIGVKKLRMDELKREVEKHQEIYERQYALQTEQVAFSGLEAANARIQDFALPSSSPIRPRKQLIIALAALASLLLSGLMAFLYEQMDDTIKSTNDIEQKLGIKLLGILPLVKSGILSSKRKLPLNPAEIKDKKGTFFEAVNTARTAVTMSDEQSYKRVIVVTSSIPGEGKSTTSTNLAYSLSQMNKVLLIDADMRKPTLAKTFDLDKDLPGLSNLVLRNADPARCIQRGVVDNLDVITSGGVPDQPLELLSSARFARLIEQLSEHYDRIVIDSAPIQAVSDAMVLSRLADSVIYCVKSHSTSIDLVSRGLQRLKQVQAPVGGVVITQVDVDKIVAYGGDYYYQGYYDYYGYNTKDKNRKRVKMTAEELNTIRTDTAENLEYDFGFDRNDANGAKPGNEAVKRDTDRTAKTGNGHERADDLSDLEFDLTTQLQQSRKPKSLRERLEDDLDLI